MPARQEAHTRIVTASGVQTYLAWWSRVRAVGDRVVLFKDSGKVFPPLPTTKEANEPKEELGGFSENHFKPTPGTPIPAGLLVVAEGLPEDQADKLAEEVTRALSYGRAVLDVRHWAKAAGEAE